jgi:restriction system protein
MQWWRLTGNIGPDTVREFRGAMVGRADQGLIISTGAFTLEARREATRDGAPPIDFISGRLLAEKLKELKLGVRTIASEHVEVVEEWFRAI